MTYNELYNAIAVLLADSGLSVYERHGVISNLEATLRLGVLMAAKEQLEVTRENTL